MLEHAIEATTYPGDVVLDCFAGSGSTALAALKLGRRTVSMEIESKWATQITARVQSMCDAEPLETEVLSKNPPKHKVPQMPLFELAAASGK
jgi:site-specific DNA-methyltransferase (adenine-specific)